MSDVVPRELQRPWEATSVWQVSMSVGLVVVGYGGKDFFPSSPTPCEEQQHRVFLIHCGSNGLGVVSSVQLVNTMKEDLHQLKLWHPGMKIMSSAVTQRCRWKAGANPVKLDKACSWLK